MGNFIVSKYNIEENYRLPRDHNQMAFVIVVVFVNIQLIIDESLSQGFPNQINEVFTKMHMLVMQQYVYSSEKISWWNTRRKPIR